MKIRKVEIHNFRAIINESCNVADYCLVVGANRAGKSSIIDAIRCFYGDIKFTESDVPKVAPDGDESWVQITYELAEEERENAPEFAGGGILKLRRWLRTDKKVEKKNAVGTLVYADRDGNPLEQQYQGWPGVGLGRIGKIVYIPAVSKPEDHDKTTGPSDLRDLLKQIMDDVVSESKEYRDLCQNIEQFGRDIKGIQSEDGQSLVQVEQAIADHLAEWGVKPEIKTNPLQPDDILKSLTKLDLVDDQHGHSQNPSAFGSGFLRHYIYTLIRVRADLRKDKKADDKKHFAPDLQLILYEEPEAFLHPPQQNVLARSLRKLAALPNTQVIVSSHSPHFASRNASDIPNTVRASRVGGNTEIFQISQTELDQLVADNDAVAQALGIDPPLLGEKATLLRYFMYLNAERSCLFFAEYVLLVEGPTELSLIHRLIDDGRITPECQGCHIIECVGKYHIHRFMSLLSHLGIPHGVLIDQDSENHANQLNQLIENTRTDFTKGIKSLAPNLESVLQYQKPAEVQAHDWKRNKPLYVLQAYDGGHLNNDGLTTFIDYVEELTAG